MNWKKLILILIFVLALTSCGKDKKYDSTIYAMDTIINITIWSNEDLIKEVEDEIIRLEKIFSLTNKDSDLYKIANSNKSEITLEDETIELIEKSLELTKDTNGALNIALYPVTKLWGFVGKNYNIPKDFEIEDKLKYTNYEDIQIDGNTLILKENMSLDLGAVAKGFIADKIIEFLKEKDVSAGILNMGGDISTFGLKPDGSKFNIAIQNPITDGFSGTIMLNDLSIATSGNYERYFMEDGVRYHHILDPKTGKPADNDLASATVISNKGIVSDGLATAFYIMGIDKTLEYIGDKPEISVIFIDNNGKVYISKNTKDFIPDKNVEYEYLK